MKQISEAELKPKFLHNTKALNLGRVYQAFLVIISIFVVVTASSTMVNADESGQPEQGIDPYTLFSRLRTAWSAIGYPDLVDYTIFVTTTVDNVTQARSYTGQLESATREFRVHSISLEEAAHPYVPQGTKIKYSLGVAIRSGATGIGSDPNTNREITLNGISNPEAPVELFAIPELSPVYSFGIRTCSTISETGGTHSSDLSIIGRVSAASRLYRISVAGIESISGLHTVHLALVALKDPHRNRLSDLWIAPTTNTLVRARISGNFVGLAESSVPWTIDFAQMDGYTYIRRETVDARLRWGHHTFDRVEISFENIKSDEGARAAFFAIPQDYHGLNAIFEPNEFFGQACENERKLRR